jgi:predicted transcriptional regulator YdeE
MNDLLTQIRQKGFTATGIAEKLKQSKSSVTMQLKGERTMTPALFKELQSIGVNLVNIANGKTEVKESETKEKTKKIKLPSNAYEIFKATKDTKGVSDNQKRIYDATIGKFFKSHDINTATSDDISIYLNKIKGNQFGFANRHLHWRNLRTYYKFLEDKYDFPNPIVDKNLELSSASSRRYLKIHLT